MGPAPRLTTWSTLVSKDDAEHAVESAFKSAIMKEGGPPLWQLLIAVVDCGRTVGGGGGGFGARRSANPPPQSVTALRERLAAAVGVADGSPATASRATVTAIGGANGKLLESDEDLNRFWERLQAARPPPAVDASKASGGERRRASGSAPVMEELGGGASDANFSERLVTEDQLLEAQAAIRACGQELEAKTAALAACQAELEGSRKDLRTCQENLATAEERLAEAEADLAGARRSIEDLEEQNLAFIRKFAEQVEARRLEVLKEVEEKYQETIARMEQELADKTGQVMRLQGELRFQAGKIRGLEADLQEQRRRAEAAERACENERTQREDEKRKTTLELRRRRQLEYALESGRRKMQELADIRFKELPESSVSEFRIQNAAQKFDEFTRGRLVQSPEFMVPRLGGMVQFEFFPCGDMNARPGWCSFRLRVPDRTRLRWSVRIGQREMEPRIDQYDSSKWFNRFGLLWLNLCEIAVAKAEIAIETGSLVVALQVFEVTPFSEAFADEGFGDPSATAALAGRPPPAITPSSSAPSLATPLSSKQRPATALASRFGGGARGPPGLPGALPQLHGADAAGWLPSPASGPGAALAGRAGAAARARTASAGAGR